MEDGVITHFLDGSVVTEPMGWGDFVEELDRDTDKRFINVKYSSNLTFTHDGYEYLNAVFLQDGHCGLVTYEARQMCGSVQRTCARGVVIIADVKFNLMRCEAETPIADDGIGARVINNLGIPISPAADRSKNTVPIATIPAISVELFDPQAAIGTYIAGRTGWDWLEAAQHAIQYITDASITVVSDWYNALPDDERYFITNGYSVRSAGIAIVRTSWNFGDLFNELAKKHNLWMGVQRSITGLPTLRIEPEAYFYSTSAVMSHADIRDLIRTCDTERLYATVTVGGSKSIKETETTLALPYIPLRGFVKEEFHLSGVCNTDENLDLVNEWVIDTNVIEDVAINGNDEYDDNLFLIQYDRTTLRATKSDYLQPGTTPYLYNEQLQNFQAIERHSLPSSVGAWTDPDDASFRATRSANVVASPLLNSNNGAAPVTVFEEQDRFDNDYTAPNFDTTNNWGNGTVQGNPVSQANSRYTAIAQGYYEFERYASFVIAQQIVSRQGPLAFAYRMAMELILERYDSGNNLISTQVAVSPSAVALNTIIFFTTTFGTSMSVGDYVIAKSRFAIEAQAWFNGIEDVVIAGITGPGVHFKRRGDWYIKTTFIAAGGYVESAGGGRVVTYEYERPVDLASWISLTDDPSAMIMIGPQASPNIPTHCLNGKRNVKTGETSWVVIQQP